MFAAEPRQGPGAYYITAHFLRDAFLHPAPSRLRRKMYELALRFYV